MRSYGHSLIRNYYIVKVHCNVALWHGSKYTFTLSYINRYMHVLVCHRSTTFHIINRFNVFFMKHDKLAVKLKISKQCMVMHRYQGCFSSVNLPGVVMEVSCSKKSYGYLNLKTMYIVYTCLYTCIACLQVARK